MKLTFVRDEQTFQMLHQAWNDLLVRSVSKVPFLRHEYQAAWWSSLGGGEWPEGQLCIAMGHDQAGELAGVAPLWFGKNQEGLPALMFIGAVEISDYLDLVVAEQDLEGFVEALFEALEAEAPEDWEELDLHNIREQSPTLAVLRSQARQRGWTLTEGRPEPCPVISLNQDWEGYLGSLSKKQRHEVRRKMRRAEQHEDGVAWRTLQAGDDPGGDFETFLNLMASDPLKTSFLTAAMRSQFEAIMRAGHEHGWLQLSLLEVGGEPAAVYLNFDYEGRLWVYNTAINPQYLDLSPGWVAIGHLVRWAIEHGRTEIDFMRGDEEYKYRLGGVDRFIRRVRIRR